MLGRTIQVFGVAVAALLVGWLIVSHNYAAMFIVAGVCAVVLLAGCVFFFIIEPRGEPGLIDEALQRRSAKLLTKKLIARMRQR